MSKTVDSKRVQEHYESDKSLSAKLDQLADMVRKSRYTVFYTGAGMSTSAGVGDYRGPSGAWTQRRIKEIQKLGSGACSSEAEELRRLLTEQTKEQSKAKQKVPMTDAQPTLSHMMQATLIRQKLAHYVVTTNLDGVYRKSGLQANKEVTFLHGDIYTERCTSCGYDFERNWHVRQGSETHVHDHSVGTCSRCKSKPPLEYTGRARAGTKTGADGNGFKENGLVGTEDKGVGTKDTHINFGECLDRDLREANKICSKADLCIVMGTSMSLRHITHLPFKARKTVIVNLQETPDDKKCHLRIWAQCDPVSAGLLSRLGLEELPVPIWRPRDALPLDQIPLYVSKTYRDAAARLTQFTVKREELQEAAEVAEEQAAELIKAAAEEEEATPTVKKTAAKAAQDAAEARARANDAVQTLAELAAEQVPPAAKPTRTARGSHNHYGELSNGASAQQEAIEKDEGGYVWSQQGDEIQITFKLQKHATKSNVKVDFKPKALQAVVFGESLLNGALGGDVYEDECTWTLVDGSELQLYLTKANANDNWKKLMM